MNEEIWYIADNDQPGIEKKVPLKKSTKNNPNQQKISDFFPQPKQ